PAPVAALLPHAHGDLDGRPLEAEGLPQATLDEAPVLGVQEARGEDHEARRSRGRLSGEEDLGLAPAAHGVRMFGDELAQEGVEPTGGDALVPAGQRELHRDRKSTRLNSSHVKISYA